MLTALHSNGLPCSRRTKSAGVSISIVQQTELLSPRASAEAEQLVGRTACGSCTPSWLVQAASADDCLWAITQFSALTPSGCAGG